MPTDPVLCLLDLETGGLDPAACAIGSAAVVRLGADLSEVDHREWLVADDPGKLWTPEALKLNGLDPETCRRQGKAVAAVLAEVGIFAGDRIVCGHNAAFDAGFLAARGLFLPRTFCTLEVARRIWPRSRNRLTDVACRIGLAPDLAHTALGDCRLVADVLRWLVRENHHKRLGLGTLLELETKGT